MGNKVSNTQVDQSVRIVTNYGGEQSIAFDGEGQTAPISATNAPQVTTELTNANPTGWIYGGNGIPKTINGIYQLAISEQLVRLHEKSLAVNGQYAPLTCGEQPDPKTLEQLGLREETVFAGTSSASAIAGGPRQLYYGSPDGADSLADTIRNLYGGYTRHNPTIRGLLCLCNTSYPSYVGHRFIMYCIDHPDILTGDIDIVENNPVGTMLVISNVCRGVEAIPVTPTSKLAIDGTRYNEYVPIKNPDVPTTTASVDQVNTRLSSWPDACNELDVLTTNAARQAKQHNKDGTPGLVSQLDEPMDLEISDGLIDPTERVDNMVISDLMYAQPDSVVPFVSSSEGPTLLRIDTQQSPTTFTFTQDSTAAVTPGVWFAPMFSTTSTTTYALGIMPISTRIGGNTVGSSVLETLPTTLRLSNTTPLALSAADQRDIVAEGFHRCVMLWIWFSVSEPDLRVVFSNPGSFQAFMGEPFDASVKHETSAAPTVTFAEHSNVHQFTQEEVSSMQNWMVIYAWEDASVAAACSIYDANDTKVTSTNVSLEDKATSSGATNTPVPIDLIASETITESRYSANSSLTSQMQALDYAESVTETAAVSKSPIARNALVAAIAIDEYEAQALFGLGAKFKTIFKSVKKAITKKKASEALQGIMMYPGGKFTDVSNVSELTKNSKDYVLGVMKNLAESRSMTSEKDNHMSLLKKKAAGAINSAAGMFMDRLQDASYTLG